MTNKNYDLVIVSCSSTKRATATEAADLYTSQLFKACRQWAEANGKAWAIASALHGVISPQRMTEPYDRELRTNEHKSRFRVLCESYLRDWVLITQRRRGLAKVHTTKAGNKIYRIDRDNGRKLRVAVLAGEKYAAELRQIFARFDVEVVEPMAGMQIGERLAYLRDERVKRAQAPKVPTTPEQMQLF
jgi:hypothetical protein